MLPDPAKILRGALSRERLKLLRWTSTRWWMPRFIRREVDIILFREAVQQLLDRWPKEDES